MISRDKLPTQTPNTNSGTDHGAGTEGNRLIDASHRNSLEQLESGETQANITLGEQLESAYKSDQRSRKKNGEPW